MKEYSVELPIYLKGESSNLVHWFIENLILFRWQYFKNHPRANYLLLKSIGSVLIGVLSIFILSFSINKLFDLKINFSDEIKKNLFHYMTAFIAAISLFYWQTSKMYQKKWLYCSDLYNKIVLQEAGPTNDYLRNSLALDLVVLDLWAHRSFKELFYNALDKAIRNNNDKTCITKIKEKKLRENEALDILQEYQNKMANYITK